MSTPNRMPYADRRRLHNQRSAEKLAARLQARSDDELARDQANYFPAGHATCKTCGRTRPISAFPETRSRRSGVLLHCADTCWAPSPARAAVREIEVS